MQGALRTAAARAAIAGAVAWGGSLLGAVQYVAANDWVEVRDLPLTMAWTAAFGAIVTAAAAVLDPALRGRRPAWAYAAAVILGPALGLGCFWLAVALRGGWVVAFPVFTCWAFGGVVALLALAAMAHPGSWPAAAGFAGGALVILLWIHSLLAGLG
jgi:hypothetical protein